MTPPCDSAPPRQHHARLPILGLGIDAGGTQTRWALARHDGQIVASGNTDGLSALQTQSASGIATLRHIFTALAALCCSHGIVAHICAGITGFGGDAQTLPQMLAHLFHLPVSSVTVSNDIDIAYRDIFKPGQGFLLYAGTGSIAAYIDEEGQFFRAGGHGYLLDDAGGGFWITQEALRLVWRNEDEAPGIWQKSAMAKNLFARIGGIQWDDTRDFLYHRSRGEIGKLALAVAEAADTDLQAMAILERAGKELARLGTIMCQRYGIKPLALSGRVQELHPVITETLRAHLPPEICLRRSTSQAHFSAARLAARTIASTL